MCVSGGMWDLMGRVVVTHSHLSLRAFITLSCLRICLLSRIQKTVTKDMQPPWPLLRLVRLKPVTGPVSLG